MRKPKTYGFEYTDDETGIRFYYHAASGVVYVVGKGEKLEQADKLQVGRHRRFIQSQILRLVRQYKEVGGKKYSAWQEANGDYEQMQFSVT